MDEPVGPAPASETERDDTQSDHQTSERDSEDESAMGAFHFLFESQRESNLNVRLEEYLRFALEAGIIHSS